jgi:hypothetical protein
VSADRVGFFEDGLAVGLIAQKGGSDHIHEVVWIGFLGEAL